MSRMQAISGHIAIKDRAAIAFTANWVCLRCFQFEDDESVSWKHCFKHSVSCIENRPGVSDVGTAIFCRVAIEHFSPSP